MVKLCVRGTYKVAKMRAVGALELMYGDPGLQGLLIGSTETSEPLPFHAVCVFENTGVTYMILEQAVVSDASSEPAFSAVAAEQISRLILVQEYGAERLFVSHAQGFGSAMP
jgi:hypothetical protein